MNDLITTELKTRIETGVSQIMSGVTSLTIQNQDHLLNANVLTKEIKTTITLIEDERKKIVKPLNDQVDDVNAYFKRFSTMLKTGETTLKGAMLKYEQDREQARLEAQRKADEEARKEREKIEAAARLQREKEEAALRKEEEARQVQLELERKAAEEKDADKRRQMEADAAEQRKKADAAALAARNAAAAAAAKENVAATVVATVVESTYQAPNGSYQVKTYSGEVVGLAMFVQYCLNNDQLNFLEVDMGRVNKVLQATKGAMKMPGIKIIESTDLRVRK